jgi:hypothetical protein
MVVKIQVEVFWVVMPCSVAVGWREQGSPKHWYPTTTLDEVTTQKTLT